MSNLIGRLIAYLFVGSFCIVGPACLAVALGLALQRAVLVYSGLSAEGTVIAKRQTGSSRITYAPVFQFTASDGRTYVVSSDVYGEAAAFRYGQRVRVLYRERDPQSARIDAFAQLWTAPLVVGAVGAGFSVIPTMVVVNWIRRRRTGGSAPERAPPGQGAADTPSRGFRWALGALLTGCGLVLLGLGLAPSDSGSSRESRVVITSLGVLLASSGVLTGQWVAVGSRLYDALGAAVWTSMAVMFGWIAVYGDAAGFSGGVSVGGVSGMSRGSATPARIAFGLAALLLGLGSVWAWRQVLRGRR